MLGITSLPTADKAWVETYEALLAVRVTKCSTGPIYPCKTQDHMSDVGAPKADSETEYGCCCSMGRDSILAVAKRVANTERYDR